MLHVTTDHTYKSQFRVNTRFTEWETARKFGGCAEKFVTKNKNMKRSKDWNRPRQAVQGL